jgi:double-stranded uracil-DNA glycosylase
MTESVDLSAPDDIPSLLPDYIATDLGILFVGINPGLRSAKVGHHFAGPSNRFWRLLYEANLVSEPLDYRQDGRLLEWRIGLTNLVSRATAGMNGLTADDYAVGRLALMRKVRRYHPHVVALLGMTLYPILFPLEPKQMAFRPGLQSIMLHKSAVVLLPNPSGRNASYSYQAMLSVFCTLSSWLSTKQR